MNEKAYPHMVLRPYIGKSRVIYYFGTDGKVHCIEKNVMEIMIILELCTSRRTVKRIAEKALKSNQIEKEMTFKLLSKLERRGIIEEAPPPKRKRQTFCSRVLSFLL